MTERRDLAAVEPAATHGAPARPGFRVDGLFGRLRSRRGRREVLQDLSEDWDLPVAGVLAILAMPLVVGVVPLVVAAASDGAYLWLTVEDGPYEWAQVVAFAVAGVLAAVLAVRHLRAGQGAFGLLMVGVAFAMVAIIGEELAWGQRLLGLQTPEQLVAINTQDELTLHNIRESRTCSSSST